MQAVERDNDSVKIVRPVVASTYFSVGNNQVYDTYLSINRYSGLDVGIGHERMRVAPFGARAIGCTASFRSRFFNYSESSRKRHDDYRYV